MIERDDYLPSTYGESFADVYDDWYADVSDVDATVTMLGAIAERGDAGRYAAGEALARLRAAE